MQDYTNQDNPYASPYSVASQTVDVRAQFIRKTYAHLAGAIAVFAALECIFLQLEPMRALGLKMATSGAGWLIVLGAYMVVSMIANKWATSNTSIKKQYLGLGIYVVAEALIFLPMLLIASTYFADQGLIMKAGFLTLAMVAGISLVAFTTKKDFSFLGGILKVGGFIALGLIGLSFIGGLNLDWHVVLSSYGSLRFHQRPLHY